MEFIVGQIVRLKKYKNRLQMFNSLRRLTSKDIKRGWYISFGEKYWLEDVNVFDECCWQWDSRWVDEQFIRGKYIQPISFRRFVTMSYNLNEKITVKVKGKLTKGFYDINSSMFYYEGWNGNFYKAKCRVDENGYVRLLGCNDIISDKQLKRILNLKEVIHLHE